MWIQLLHVFWDKISKNMYLVVLWLKKKIYLKFKLSSLCSML